MTKIKVRVISNRLTAKQEELLELYKDKTTWRPMSMTEMVKKVGLSSNRSLIDMRTVMTKKGYLKKVGKVFYPTEVEQPLTQLPIRDFSMFRYSSGGTTNNIERGR